MLVGKERESYYIHEDLLQIHSPYFATALKPYWNDGKAPMQLELENASPAAFDVVVHWIYEQNLPTYSVGQSKDGDDETPAQSINFMNKYVLMYSVYKLADFLLMHDLQNAVMDARLKFLREGNVHCTLCGISQLYDAGMEGTLMYEMAIRNYADAVIGDLLSKEQKELEIKEFDGSLEVLKAAFLRVEELRCTTLTLLNDERDKCKYHVHPDGKKCES